MPLNVIIVSLTFLEETMKRAHELKKGIIAMQLHSYEKPGRVESQIATSSAVDCPITDESRISQTVSVVVNRNRSSSMGKVLHGGSLMSFFENKRLLFNALLLLCTVRSAR